MIQAAYIHIPFCTHICHYCDFNKVFLHQQPVDAYIDALIIEMERTFERFPTPRLQTVFIGGGTPTSLTAKQLERLLRAIHRIVPLASNVEFTVEANPDGVSDEQLHVLKQWGVNRLSFGVQTFDDELLTRIGRTHTKETAIETIERAHELGFYNINIDLMYGLPTQTIAQLKETLHMMFSLPIQHVSAYSLIIEPKTVFYNLMRKSTLSLPSQEEEAYMYEIIMEQMEQHGYKQYELSNYARNGFYSRHNMTYWNNEYYYGFGAGAHSYMNGVRYVNAGPIKKYIQLIQQGQLPYVDTHVVSKEEEMEEYMFLGLRKIEGINKDEFFQRYGKTVHAVFNEAIALQKQDGLLEETDEAIFLTHRGKLLGNEVFQSFLGVSS
ncbi:radical SAM family heme chaperone HemW [Anoxybacillus suryakundensis]|uniref:Heme chaperone HemW n=1 Tax=Anoxybacillus suryakundensis TaxID=1325335 RepID=A0A0K6GMM0_9BACL|nr:radical SAM family heme chaperone HemW [Anoxybacillus suryakundensis]CUA79950.1 putative oxygen-independent coproporphyrinogen III oxidase [Anoxybacillus suryakundensis]